MKDDCDLIVRTSAKYMRSNIKNYCNIVPLLIWTPTIEELMKDERMPPLSVVLFLKNLLKNNKHTVSAKKMRLIETYASNFIHGVKNDEFLTSKTFPVRSWIT